jgi:hypothetical protein
MYIFQVTLRPNGDIVFVYIEVQSVLSVAALYDHEPVAGISGRDHCLYRLGLSVGLKWSNVSFVGLTI